ncbi:MAG TPA: hypothetical protein VN132_03265 [Bdellovibrio sp.]|nr:hypothetical protein [Bdellovibrio sp.]
MTLLFLSFLLRISGFLQEANAGEITVVDVHRNITLSENEPVYKDFYLNAGPDSGLKKNLVVMAVRKLNIRDASGANAVGEILVPVGQLKVIAIYDRVAVAREFNLPSRDELPMLEQTGIMSGDRIDLKGSFVDNSKPKIKHKVAVEQTPTTTQTPTAATPAVTAPAVTVANSQVPLPPTIPVQQKANDLKPTSTAPATVQNSGQGPTPASVSTAPAPAPASVEKVLEKPSEKSVEKTQEQTQEKPVETLEKVADSGNNSGHE